MKYSSYTNIDLHIFNAIISIYNQLTVLRSYKSPQNKLQQVSI